MSDDRLAQARAEAWRRYPEGWDPYNEEPVDDWGYSECQREAFRAGVEWADANPRPRTITRAEFLEALDAHVGVGASGDWVTVEDMLIAAFMAVGFEVRDE